MGDTDVERFKDYFSILLDEIQEDLVRFAAPSDAIEWIRACLEYTVPGGTGYPSQPVLTAVGKMNRGVAAVKSARILGIPDDGVHQAIVLGWCIEILQACFLIADDVMDQSTQRRGQPCWHKKVGLTAVNDSLLLQSVVYQLLHRHFAQAPFYTKLTDLFRSVTFRTEIGQLLDLTTFVAGSADPLRHFTHERYIELVKNKTAYYSFVLPVHSTLILMGLDAPKALAEMEHCFLSLGIFFQIQDDYLDFYGDPAKTGKIGTDIEEGKCTWLALRFLERASAEQRTCFEQSLGRPDRRQAIDSLYREMNLDEVFDDYQDNYRRDFAEIVAGLKSSAIKSIAEFFSALILGRQA